MYYSVPPFINLYKYCDLCNNYREKQKLIEVMCMSIDVFEQLSSGTELGVVLLELSGELYFKSSEYIALEPFLDIFYRFLNSQDADKASLLYSCYQSRRFGGRYTFLTSTGLAYCVSPLYDDSENLWAGSVIGPFLLSDYEEFIDIDVLSKHQLDSKSLNEIRSGIYSIPYKTPVQARAVSELLYICTDFYQRNVKLTERKQSATTIYSIGKENELLSAISRGDIQAAGAVLNEILGNILFDDNINIDILRLHVIELTVLLSRAALRGGANSDAIFGLNLNYLQEIDKLKSAEEVVMWLHSVTKRFSQHVFDYADSKHADILYRAIAFIKNHYADKITLQNIADSVYLNVSYFSKIFKEETGQTPGNYISMVRIDESKKLLANPSISIIDIPELVGFDSQSYFTQVFKKSVGCTPGQYRRQISVM